MTDFIDDMIAVFSNIREVTFRTPPTDLVSIALGECAQGQIDITLVDPVKRRPGRRPTFHELSDIEREPWASNIVCLKLRSDHLSDIRELEHFPRLKTLELDTGLKHIDPGAMSEAQIVISEMKNLENLTIYVATDIEEEAKAYLHWPMANFDYSVTSFRPKHPTRRQRKLSPSANSLRD